MSAQAMLLVIKAFASHVVVNKPMHRMSKDLFVSLTTLFTICDGGVKKGIFMYKVDIENKNSLKFQQQLMVL